MLLGVPLPPRHRPLRLPEGLVQAGALVHEHVPVAEVGAVHAGVVGAGLELRQRPGAAVLALVEDQEAAMGEGGVQSIAGVVPRQLPVAPVDHALAVAHLDAPRRGPVHEPVDQRPGRAEPLRETGCIEVERAEDQAAVRAQPRHLGQAVVGFVKVRRVALTEGHVDEVAAVGVGPAVVGALEAPGRTALGLAHARGPVGAAVEQGVQAAVLVAGDDQGPQPHVRRQEIVGVGHLALVGQINPGAAEHLGHLGIEDRGVGVDGAMDPVGLDQSAKIGRRGRIGNGRHVGTSLLRTPGCIYSTKENLRTSPRLSTSRTILNLIDQSSPSEAST